MRAIAEGLFTEEIPPRLVGGRDRATGRIVFPRPSGEDYEAVALSRDGTLWSYTVQRFRPKSPPYIGPEAFSPWIVAYVELADQTIVEARLVDVEQDEISIGMRLQLVQAPLDPDSVDSVLIPAFAPAGEAA